MMMKKLLTGALLSILLALPALADTVWIDVRSYPEYRVDHIDGDLRLDHDKIVAQVSERYPDKTTEIRLYCASGGRADAAARALREAGYTHAASAGGIDQARQQRGLAN